MIRKIFIFFAVLVSFNLFAQSHTTFGQWKSYLPYNKVRKLTETKNKIFCSSDLSMYSVDKKDYSVEFYDKTNYLSDLDIVFHSYDKYNDQLIIAYSNGNIDFLADKITVNISDIKKNSNIYAKRSLNDIYVADDNHAYFASDFGIMQFDTKDYEFGFTCFTDFKINAVIFDDNTIFIGSDNGIYSFDISSGNNPNDISQWDKIYDSACLRFLLFNDKLIFHNGKEIYGIGNDFNIEKLYSLPDSSFDIRSMYTRGQEIYIGAFYDANYASTIIITDLKGHNDQFPGCTFSIQDFLIDDNGIFWYADNDQNLLYSEGKSTDCKKIFIDSPYSFECSDIVTLNDIIYVASGGANKMTYNYNSSQKGFYIYKNDSWTNFNRNSNKFLRDNNIDNTFALVPDNANTKLYLSSFGRGLVEMNLSDNSMKLYDYTNSKLEVTPGDAPGSVRINDMQMDSEGNLWMTLFGTDKPLVVKTSNGLWYSFAMQDGLKYIAELDIDQNNRIWLKTFGKGIMVFDYNETIENPTDDKFIILNTNNTNLQSNNINYINTDLDNNVWVGTEKGPLVFECAESVMNGECSGTKKKTVLGGIAEYVLNEVNINCIEFDGANRKWIGTGSGVYVLNSEGDEEIARYTFENSPLFDNYIVSLAYNGQTGEMMIGTLKGFLSLKTETTKGESYHEDNAYAYPNPVPPDYDGLIAFKGLARDSNVKITDVAGNLVFETTASGGQAIWDGKDFKGNRVGSGVYIVFALTSDSYDEPKSTTLKLFFVK